MRLLLHLRENFNIVVNGLVQNFGGKDQRKRKCIVKTGLKTIGSKVVVNERTNCVLLFLYSPVIYHSWCCTFRTRCDRRT